jgi:hypothetical protein
VVEIKDKEPNPYSESDSKNTGKSQIIDLDPTTIVATATIQLEEPTYPEEGGAPFSFIDVVEGDLAAFYC